VIWNDQLSTELETTKSELEKLRSKEGNMLPINERRSLTLTLTLIEGMMFNELGSQCRDLKAI